MKLKRLLTTPELTYARRLVLVVVWLLLIDRAVGPVLRFAERRRYESNATFRFENSDLFALGPLVRYLRENPKGERRRIVFMGDSVMFGYFLSASEALPAQFEREAGTLRVFNASLNGNETGTSYLIGKSLIDSVDGLVVQYIGHKALPLLPSLIPVEPEDARKLKIEMPNRIETATRSWLSRIWRLHDMNDRLQAAAFGTSTRQYIYLHKGEIVMSVLRPSSTPPARPAPPLPAPGGDPPRISAPRGGRVADLARYPQVLRDFAFLANERRKRVLFITFAYDKLSADHDAAAAFNDAYAPYAEMAIVFIPKSLTFDGQHLSPQGCAAVARELWAHERERLEEIWR